MVVTVLRNFEAIQGTMASWHGNGNQFGWNLDQRYQESGVQKRCKEMYGDTLASSTIFIFGSIVPSLEELSCCTVAVRSKSVRGPS